MKKIIAVMLVGIVGLSLATVAQAGIGSCYEVQPICIGTHPVCVCDTTMNCFWSCQ